MRRLILVKHASPKIVPGVPANRWRLSEEGRARCGTLADHLSAHRPDHFVASVEPKAEETARIVAGLLDKPYSTAEGLHEHDRSNVAWLGTEEFEASVARFFDRPHALVFGRETAAQAQQRFTHAVAAVIERHPEGNLAVFAHGTVIALFVAQAAGVDSFGLWQRLDLPSFAVLSLPDLELLTVVERMEQSSSLWEAP